MGPINEIMDMLQITKEDGHNNRLEHFYMYIETAKNNPINY
jgi:hypothetical protein